MPLFTIPKITASGYSLGLGMTLTELKLTERGIKRLRWTVTALLMVIITYQTVQFSRQLWELLVVPIEPEVFDVDAIVIKPSYERLQNAQRYQEQLPYTLFGEYVPPVPKVEELPVTELNIQLLAIMYSNNKADSAVMINSEGESGLYYQGDKLPGGTEIKEIFANQITLSRNNKVERLLIDDIHGEQYAGMFNASQPLSGTLARSGAGLSQPPVYDPGDQSNELRDELEALRDMLNSPS